MRAAARAARALVLGPAPAARLRERVETAKVGTGLAFLRDGARLARSGLERLLTLPVFGGLQQLFSLQRRLEGAFLASGGAAQLADAALLGETSAQLAVRIARIARRLSGAAGVAVHGVSGVGLQLLGADGEACDGGLASRAVDEGAVVWGETAAAIPLLVREAAVGALSLRFPGPPRDLRCLQPLLARAGAVIATAEREARKDRFLSLAAHELKTPLTSIKGFSYSLARRLERGEPCDPRHVEVLERQAERLHGLLEEMLEVSRLETGRFTLHQEPVELGELIAASTRGLRRLGVSDVEASPPPHASLVADRERIERAVTALALRARALGRARLETAVHGQEVEFRAAWDGPSLSEEERARAFEPRWELSTGQRQGLGMALFVAGHAAELHGGSLVAEPCAFVLRLPLSLAPTRAQAALTRSILVVDDDEPLARMLAEFLGESGFAVRWAGGGHSALLLAHEAAPDLLVLDLRMPDLDGRALLAQLREEGQRPRVVLLSADREVAVAARELACDGFVEKPFSPEGLLGAVHRALGLAPGAASR